MAFTGGFGRESGPSAPPKSQPLFGQFSPPSPPPPFPTNPPAVRSYRESSAMDALPAEPRTQLLVSRPQDLQQAQTPFFPFGNEDSSRHSKVDAVGGAVPLPSSIPKKKVLRIPDFPSQLVPLSSGNGANAENGINKDLGPAVPKRTRSPPLLASQVFQGNSCSTEGDNERELEAKAKRLARFKTELSAPIPNVSSLTAKNDRPKLEKQKVIGNYMESAENFPGDVDIEGPQPPGVIIGLCPDMCPGSEREERERKGDLDHYERLDGDRNQSSRELAVKKYTRTAEREARLIRPLPTLQKTMDYLLNLLDQPYSDSFLALYNFLWDRMRAIRMDLRMQHIFNLEAITMLEQMIRLHIIAMHELCEYTKGEGFSEGFDAHLNIEQMNKTSVELFQMYDDYRKKGVHVPTEKEFRGYYALLKLDKHPGYKVEPGELSLDLAKMTPEIRQTKEVLLARDVARSCRTGNFISFFRLGMKASYLQACLMHAHFSKLRTQALASLHSGLQNNQGLPIAHVAKWLGLENEDVESLLEYHGFSFKDFGELYMVKDGPFLNIDKDFPTRCSVLVHSKKSKHVIEDILSPHQVTTIPPQASKEPKPMKVIADKPLAVYSIKTVDDLTVTAEKVRSLDASPSSERGMQFQQGLKRARNILLDQENHPNNLASSPKFRTQVEPVPPVLQFQHNKEDRDQRTEKEFQPWNFSAPKTFSENQQVHFQKVADETPVLPSPAPSKNDVQSNLQQMPLVNVTRHVEQEHSSAVESVIANSVQQDTVIDKANGEEFLVAHDFDIEGVVTHCYDEEVAKAKLKLFLRLWRRRCASKRAKREQNRLAAIAALNSLSVGPPLQRKQDRRNSYERFNIDEVMNKRYKKHEESWSTFSVSDIVTDILCERNPRSSCICWKVVLCYHTIKMSGTGLTNHVTHYSADQWLHSKFMPSTEECNDDLVISSPGVAIWRKWIGEQSQSTCLSVIKSINFSNLNQDVAGANGVVFLLSEGIEWDSQKVQLQNLIAALPCRSCMPLLILCGSSAKGLCDQTSAIVDKLGLHELDKSRISSFLIVHLHESQDIKKLDGYFSDKQLREGLKWLASKSHPQPVLWSVKTRALVLSHLNTSLDALDHMGVNIIGPNQCISAFNEALDKSVEDIVAAASANPIGWPCPELSLLYDADEYRVSKLLLPSIGWSSAEAIEPFLSALRHCKLPVFLDDTSFLKRGSKAGDELEEQRLQLQDCLISYLNQSSRMMNLTMAMKEASIMLQKNARLELHNTSYYVVPNWVHIFRRVFNWQLNALAINSCSTAYILEKDDPLSVTRAKSDIAPVISDPSYTAHPSLDEMLEVSLTRPSPWSLRPPPEAARHAPSTGTVVHNNPNETNEASPLHEVRQHTPQIQSGLDFGSPLVSNMKDSSSDFAIPSGFAREADKLTRLIEKCNMVQNKIAEKLSIYF